MRRYPRLAILEMVQQSLAPWTAMRGPRTVLSKQRVTHERICTAFFFSSLRGCVCVCICICVCVCICICICICVSVSVSVSVCICICVCCTLRRVNREKVRSEEAATSGPRQYRLEDSLLGAVEGSLCRRRFCLSRLSYEIVFVERNLPIYR
jgi:hypothetical protein